MILICPSCDTQYFADDATIGESGRTVKCAACAHSWFVPGDGETAAEHESEAEAEKKAEIGAHEAYRQQVRQRRRQKSRIAAITSWLVTAIIFFSLGALAIIFRNEVVQSWPESASIYRFAGIEVNRFGLDFSVIDASRTFDGTTPVLNVTGEIVNISKRARNTPKVRVGLRDEYQREVAFMLADVEPHRIASGETGHFTAILEDPPVEAFDLELSFIEIGGARSVAESAGRIEAADAAGNIEIDGEGENRSSDGTSPPREDVSPSD